MDHLCHFADGAAVTFPLSGVVGLAVPLFLTGLLGGFAHCGGMCAPFVLGQLGGAAASEAPLLHRLAGAALMPYHVGRLTTYTALGAVAGALGQTIVAVTRFHWLLSAVLGLAAVLLLAQAARRALPRLNWPRLLGFAGGPLAALAARLAAFSGTRGYGLGLALGFLPCGFLYAALAAAASGGTALSSGIAMAAFALGTVPSLMVVALLGTVAAQRWRRVADLLAPTILAANAILLAEIALEQVL